MHYYCKRLMKRSCIALYLLMTLNAMIAAEDAGINTVMWRNYVQVNPSGSNLRNYFEIIDAELGVDRDALIDSLTALLNARSLLGGAQREMIDDFRRYAVCRFQLYRETSVSKKIKKLAVSEGLAENEDRIANFDNLGLVLAVLYYRWRTTWSIATSEAIIDEPIFAPVIALPVIEEANAERTSVDVK